MDAGLRCAAGGDNGSVRAPNHWDEGVPPEVGSVRTRFAGPPGCGELDVGMDGLAAALRDRLGERVRLHEPLARYTSLRIGGPADVFVRAESVDDVEATLAAAATHGVSVFVLGGGTNLLVSDRGVRGLVLTLGRAFEYIGWSADATDALVVVGAAARIGRIVRRTVEGGLGGLECAEGIPGTVGGGLLTNAGAYGVELGAVVETIVGIDAAGVLTRLSREMLRFRYRQLTLPPGFVATEVTLKLRCESTRVLRARLQETRQRRELAQPKGRPNVGSMFKNPPDDHAARLIDAADLKGSQIGQAQISGQHANFFVNLGGAKAVDVKALMDLAQRVVWERFHVWLEPEVRLVGQW